MGPLLDLVKLPLAACPLLKIGNAVYLYAQQTSRNEKGAALTALRTQKRAVKALVKSLLACFVPCYA